MKKTLITLMMSLLVIVAMSQSLVSLKAYTYNFGIKNKMGEGNADDIVWIGEQECRIPISLSDEDAIVYSEDIQHYTVLETITTEDQYTWLASDNKGGRCYLTILGMDDGTDNIMIVIEYMDSAWYYVCNVVYSNSLTPLRSY